MNRALATIALLILSNTFMTLAWYGHIAFKSKIERFGMLSIILLSWGIALFEYCFQVPANRIGSSQLGGPFSIWELKVIQEVISPAGLHGLRRRLHEIGHPAVEPSGGFRLPDSGRLFHLPQIATWQSNVFQ